MRFCGRSDELEILKERWKLSSNLAAPAPQLVIVKAERGVGKTRLALEFFRWLVENVESREASQYWPDGADILNSKFDVNPDPYSCHYDQPMPFLWWGIRAADPGAENPISGDAIASYGGFLAPHLAAVSMKARAIKSGKALGSVWRDVVKGGVMSMTGYDTAISVSEGLFKSVQILRGTLNKSRASVLSEVTKKSINRVDAILEDLEIVLNPRSLGFAKTPGVILIDDAQFTPEELGLADFCEKLLHKAITEGWPLMIVVTHWKRDLSTEFMKTERSFAGILWHAKARAPHENGPVSGLPGGYLTAQNTAEIDLSPVADLSDALNEAVPGLLPDQAAALLDHAGGNPRHLEQIIAYLRENEELFVDPENASPLTDEGLREALKTTHHIFTIVMRRLRDAPVEVQEAICLASLQGMRFVPGIVNELAQVCLSGDRAEALKKAADPFSMVTSRQATSIGEFSERLFYLVADKRRRSLKGVRDDEKLTATLRGVLRARIDQIDQIDLKTVKDADEAVAVLGLAAQVFWDDDPVAALNALSLLAALEDDRYSMAAAHAAAKRFLDLFSPDLLASSEIDIRNIMTVPQLLMSMHLNRDALRILTPLQARARTSAIQQKTSSDFRLLARVLDRVGRAEMDNGNPVEAFLAWHESLQIRRRMLDPLAETNLTQDLSIELERGSDRVLAMLDLVQSLHELGHGAMRIGDLDKARELWREQLEVCRDLVNGLGCERSEAELALALDNCGTASMAAGDPSGAAQLFSESLVLRRHRANRDPVPEALRELSIALDSVADAAIAIADLPAAMAACKESLAIRRDLFVRLGTVNRKHDLFVSLHKASYAAIAVGDWVSVAEYGEEGLRISQELASNMPKPHGEHALANSLDLIARLTMMLKDWSSAVDVLRECLRVRQGMVSRYRTPESDRDMCVSFYLLSKCYKMLGDSSVSEEVLTAGDRLAEKLPTHIHDALVKSYSEVLTELKGLH